MKNYGNKKGDDDSDMFNYEDDYDMNVFKNNIDDRNNDNENRRSSQDNTMINLNINQPIGLDINNFISNVNNCDQTVHNISTSNDLPIISEVYFCKSD